MRQLFRVGKPIRNERVSFEQGRRAVGRQKIETRAGQLAVEVVEQRAREKYVAECDGLNEKNGARGW
jgi:hypothetical protein